MANNDVQYITRMLSNFGKDYFSKQDENDAVNMSMTGSKVSTRKSGRDGKDNNKTEDFICNFNEIPKFMYDLLKEHTKLMIERSDTKLDEMKEHFDNKLEEKDTIISNLRKELRVTKNELDALAQYNRRDNLKIEGVEYQEGENTLQIIKDIGEQIGVPIQDSDISVVHRIMPNKKDETTGDNSIPGASNTQTKKIPSIIARFNRRQVKINYFEARKTLITKLECPDKIKAAEVYEDVTPLRSRIMYELRHRGNKLAFRYVWSRGGRIYCRTPEEVKQTPMPKPHIINKPEDLKNVGFNETEIETIIKNIRK